MQKKPRTKKQIEATTENLKKSRLDLICKEDARKIQSRGGKKHAETIQKEKDARKVMEFLLFDTTIKDENGDEVTRFFAMIRSLADRAIEKGDPSAASLVLNIIKQLNNESTITIKEDVINKEKLTFLKKLIKGNE